MRRAQVVRLARDAERPRWHSNAGRGNDRGGRVIEEVFINRKDWRKTALAVGRRLRFQMVHRPKGMYALPVRVHHRGGLGSE
ncbi:hypothetical protein BFW90_17570 [Pseudomonas fluorescens]|nr:hypothetical protein BFW90_17570 [Pseudomonas fluorescens]